MGNPEKKPRVRRLAKQPLCEAIVQWKGEHDRSVANGTVELINPSTNMPLRFNMKRFINVMFGHTMLPQLAKRGRVLTAGDLEDGKRTDQDLFQNFLVQYNDSGKSSYSHHAFEYVDDFADAADFSTFPTTEWENAKRKFGELMADYEKLRNRRSGIHGSFAETMAEDMKTSSTHTYPLMLYLQVSLKWINPCLTRACLIFPRMFSASLPPGCLVRNQRTRVGADTNDRGGKVGNPQQRTACRVRF